MSHDTQGPTGTPKKTAAKPKQKDHKHKVKVQTRKSKGLGRGDKGMRGTGGLVGIGATSDI